MSESLNKDQTKQLRDRVEYVVLFLTASICILIAVLDLMGVFDASSWVANRIPALTLLGIGFVASYLIIERRGKLDYMTALVEERTEAILRTIGVEITTYKSSGDFASDFAARLLRAKYVDDTTWNTEEDKHEKWSGQDIRAYQHLHETVTEVVRKHNIIWREVMIFSDKSRFEQEKRRVLEDTPGYNLGIYDMQSETDPPRIGFAVIDNGEEEAEVFLSNDNIRLRIKHPVIAAYFAQYFEIVWSRAKKLKTGSVVNKELLEELEIQLAQQNSQ